MVNHSLFTLLTHPCFAACSVMLPYSLLILVIQEVRLEHFAADGQRRVLEEAERVGEAHVVGDAGILGEQDAGAVALHWDLGAVLAGALNKDNLADVLLVAALELDRVHAGLVSYAVNSVLDGTGAKVLALQPDLGACDQEEQKPRSAQCS